MICVGHGGYPAGVRDAVEMILGEQDHVVTVALPPDGSPNSSPSEVSAAIDRLGGDDGALVLADLMGGSPANAVGLLALRDPALHVVSGLNLPMVLEVLTSIGATAAELAAVAAHAGRDGVLDVAARLRRRGPDAGHMTPVLGHHGGRDAARAGATGRLRGARSTSRPSGVHDRLTASLLWLSGRPTRAVCWVAVDALSLDVGTAARIRADVARPAGHAGRRGAGLLLAHALGAGDVVPLTVRPRRLADDAAINRLVRDIARGAGRLPRRPRRSRPAGRTVADVGVGANRYDPAGPHDTSAPAC